MTQDAPLHDDARARRNIAVLVLAQALLGAQMSMIFTVGGLAGKMLAPNPCWATLPISMMVAGSMIAARPLSGYMQRHGRRAGFTLAALIAAGGAALVSYAIWANNFWLMLPGSLMGGFYMSAQGFFRFAATDTASPEFQPKAISYVMAGGLAAALTGPFFVKLTAEALPIPFLGTYLAVIGLNLLGPILFAFLSIPKPKPPREGAHTPLRALLTRPVIAVAMICGMVSYALMNLVMTSSPLAMVGCGFATSDAASVVSAHVLAMYIPSFFTGHLIARFGRTPIIALGLFILAASGAVAMTGVEIETFYIGLILLGIGWNFGFIGATSLLATGHSVEERGRVQGINDFVVFAGVFLASLSSGGLMNCSGGSAEAGWQAVNLAMLPFLVLAGGALVWLALRPRETR